MARKFFYGTTVPSSPAYTSRLGAQNAPYKDTEIGKLVKGTTESGHVLCAAGDLISGQIVGVEAATSDGFGIGSVNRKDRIVCWADGLQATPGTGAIALHDQVVCGTVTALGTAMNGGVHLGLPKVTKATTQIGAGAPDAAQMAAVISGNVWKVVSLGAAGTGAVGTEIVIERVFNFA